MLLTNWKVGGLSPSSSTWYVNHLCRDHCSPAPPPRLYSRLFAGLWLKTWLIFHTRTPTPEQEEQHEEGWSCITQIPLQSVGGYHRARVTIMNDMH